MTWLGPEPLALTMPVELADADPLALRARAAVHREDAEVAAQQARALRAAVVRLVPAAWLGLGSLSFAQSALLQAGGLETIAAACADVATALDALAGGLEQARAEAQATVGAARRLDEEVAADNAAWARRPEPERADPDPARLAAQDVGARQLVARLAIATAAAQQAWLRATAVFDLVAYRMPDLTARMREQSGDDWRPSANLSALPDSERRHLLGVSPVCVTAGWAGAGALVGPDGRRYPLVVPWVEEDGVRWTADRDGVGSRSTETLDGADPGWHEIGVRVGVDTFGAAASPATRAAVITAGFVGNAPKMIGRLRPDLLARLQWSPAGVPSLAASPAVPAQRVGGTVTAPRAALIRDGDELRWVPDTSTERGIATRDIPRQNPGLETEQTIPAAPNAVALADSGLTGLDTARRLDDGRVAAYRATFEENDDGRMRARITTYQVAEGDDGPNVLARDLAVGPDGRLLHEPVSYRAPQGFSAAPSDAAH